MSSELLPDPDQLGRELLNVDKLGRDKLIPIVVSVVNY
jgi:hypothetical protein